MMLNACEMKSTAAQLRWYKGDLHMDAGAAGGRPTPESARHQAVLRELDFYVPAGRRVSDISSEKRAERHPAAWAGMEISSSLGQMNLLGADRAPRALQRICSHTGEERLKADYEDLISECKKRGWLISMSRPFDAACRWRWPETAIADLDCIEITDGQTIALTDLLWEDGYRICAAGGSGWNDEADGRSCRPAGYDADEIPATWLCMKNVSADSLKAAVRACCGYVSRGCVVRTNLTFGAQLPEEQRKLDFEISLCGCREKPQIFFRHNGLMHVCTKVQREADGWCTRGSIRLNDRTSYHCIRFGARTTEGKFLFYANPVTKGRAVHRLITFGDAADRIEKESLCESGSVMKRPGSFMRRMKPAAV